jgi:myo-inositol-1(or 4)-monophosphatase|tara:strand:- start:27101 stop:27907 length:807 start_codon:yes stop_codon:yes gene_type:complete
MKHELSIAKNAAVAAGEIILKYYKSDYEVRDKGQTKFYTSHNPVTTADNAANDYLKEIINCEFPDDGWFSEETVDSPERLDKDRVWIVDPLDGTKEFIEGVPNFVVSIAMVIDQRPHIGILYNPVTKELFSSIRRMGSWLNDEPIECTSLDGPKSMVILNSRSETKKGLWSPYSDKFKELRAIGSVAYKLGLISAGKADIFVSLRPKNEWDICAGHCIIEGAGGVLLNIKGETIKYNKKDTLILPGIIAGHPDAVGKVLNIFSNHSLK